MCAVAALPDICRNILLEICEMQSIVSLEQMFPKRHLQPQDRIEISMCRHYDAYPIFSLCGKLPGISAREARHPGTVPIRYPESGRLFWTYGTDNPYFIHEVWKSQIPINESFFVSWHTQYWCVGFCRKAEKHFRIGTRISWVAWWIKIRKIKYGHHWIITQKYCDAYIVSKKDKWRRQDLFLNAILEPQMRDLIE